MKFLGNRGQLGGLFIWAEIIFSIALFAIIYIVLDPIITNTLPGIADTANASTASTLINDNVTPIWRMSFWGFAIGLILYAIFKPLLSTPGGYERGY